MTRILYIVRHAKAEERGTFMDDHSRDLLPEGFIAAARMGRFLHDEHHLPDHIISSTANRARDTAKAMAEQLAVDADRIYFDDALFNGGPKAYLAAVNALPDTLQAVMIVGHNPDVSYFAEYLTHEDVGNMSKGAVIAVAFENLSWAGVSGRTGTIVLNKSPKALTDS